MRLETAQQEYDVKLVVEKYRLIHNINQQRNI